MKFTYKNTIRGFAVNASAQGVSKMQANNPRIAYCEQDQVMATAAKSRAAVAVARSRARARRGV